MISVDEALDKILAAFERLPAERIPLDDGLQRVLATDLHATQDLPPFPNSSMDGYALRAADVVSASRATPVQLTVIADIPAGSAPTVTVSDGQAARIMTGAPLPAGADTIVPVEQTDDAPSGFRPEEQANRPPGHIRIFSPGKPGDYIRPVGEDIRAGQVVLHAGRVLRPADLGVLAGLGIGAVDVIRRPVVAILSTGDELLAVGEPLSPGKIRDTNGITLTALAQAAGAITVRLGIARDTADDVRARLQQAIDRRVDVIISSAGVSVGTYDVVKSVIDSLGALEFWKVNMRPGKPVAFGQVQGIPFLGLPGNPVSAMVTFDVFAYPTILKLAGRDTRTATATAELVEPMTSDGRRTFMRVKLTRSQGRLIAHSTGTQSSGALSSMVYADGLMIIPEGMTDIPAGTPLPVRLFTDTIDAG
jgi:molybdopterin molybdotransferase